MLKGILNWVSVTSNQSSLHKDTVVGRVPSALKGSGALCCPKEDTPVITQEGAGEKNPSGLNLHKWGKTA